MFEQTVTDFVIDRRRWLRGEGSLDSRLLRPGDLKMCCLGFYGLACGIPRPSLMDKETPLNIGEAILAYYPEMSWLLHNGESLEHTDDARLLMEINDGDIINEKYEPMSDVERERLIIKIFARHNIKVTFIN